MDLPQGEFVKSRRATSPHLPHGGTIAIRDREIQRFGFVVDGDVAASLDLAFVPHRVFPEVRVAHTESPWGIGVTVVTRSRRSAQGYEADYNRTVEALEDFNVRQMVSLSHRVLLPPEEGEVAEQVHIPDVLTVGIQPIGACKRLLSAVYSLARTSAGVRGVFTRDDKDLSDMALNAEGEVARALGFCTTLIEATTFRTDVASRASEQTLGAILRAIPDTVSPLTSCMCHTTRTVLHGERAG
jgi:hypothetical protein